MPATVEPTTEAVAEAVDRLRQGRPVAFPTETVYGLGADTFNEAAVELVCRLKGRPADNPLIAHVPEPFVALRLAAGWDERCEALVERFWPGPLTLVVAKAGDVPARSTAGLPTIAIRCPRHPVARTLLVAFGGAVSAPSANRSGRVSPTTAAHVAADFADVEDLLILDGGRCEVGIESTVLDVTVDPPRVLRPGSVTAEELRAVVGEVDETPARGQAASPGTSLRHYAPRTPAELVPTVELAARLAAARGERLVVLAFDAEVVPPPHRVIVMPQGAADYARVLYESLRRADAMGMDGIVIEEPPATNEIWRAVCDRLARATG